MPKTEDALDTLVSYLKQTITLFETKRGELQVLDRDIAKAQSELHDLNNKVKDRLAHHDQVQDSLASIKKMLMSAGGASK
jgi:septation ring formation regulator EzrA